MGLILTFLSGYLMPVVGARAPLVTRLTERELTRSHWALEKRERERERVSLQKTKIFSWRELKPERVSSERALQFGEVIT